MANHASAGPDGAPRVDRRADIVDAAYRCVARHGYERATTARICATAGVSSGTFFHYFPTKNAVLLAILEDDLDRTRELCRRLRDAAAGDAVAALSQWQEHVLADAAQEHLAGFVAALGAVPDDAAVAAALQTDDALVHDALVQVVTAGREQGTVRGDVPADRLALWLGIVARGVLVHVVEDGATARALSAELGDVVERLVRP